jgi:thioredoxin 2
MTAAVTPRASTVDCPHCGKRNRVPAAADGVPKCGNCHQALPWIVDAGDDDFPEVVEHSPVPVLVDLWATWCGPCRMVSDVDASPRLSRRFEVRAVPTLMVWRGGELLARQPGAAPEPALRSWLDQALQSKGSEDR